MKLFKFAVLQFVLVSTLASPLRATDLRVLFLGDDGHHQPAQRFALLAPVLADRGIRLTYTDEVDDLSADKLSQYDALLLYANIDRIAPQQEKALLDYVQQGGGFVPIHSATYCFRNSRAVVALMGAQFKSHGTGVFRALNAKPNHPIMRGFGGFESWDETYVHHLHNEKDRTVLEYRVDQNGREPWTWVRTHGAGRVFYTAWGHDQRTWGNAGFQNLIERGIRWAAKDDPATTPSYLKDQLFPATKMTSISPDVKPFQYVDSTGKIPNYVGKKREGKAFTAMQAPLPPEESLKHLVVPEGFRVELFVAEPDLAGKPICMAWDERGRLWVAETYDYPNELQPAGQGRDRIRICEDTDGDQKADKFTIFAEQLSIPTSITFHRGGVIVQDGTRTLYMKDTDGDDVADERRTLFTGWSQSDTHGGVSNFQYGLDNWIWAMQGYNRSQPTAGKKKHQEFRNGFFRFRPDGSEVEFLRSTNNNTWGLGISEEGLVFGSTANRNPSVYMPIANRYYERVRGWAPSLKLGATADTHLFKPITKKIRQVDQHGGYTAAAGHALYTARNYPQHYWNRTAFVNGPTGHLVGTFVLQRQGSDFRSTNPLNLLASDDEWTAPIMSEVGPDGNVWTIDWYNYIVQHNPTPIGFETGPGNAYKTKLRDKKHGRIYRVVYEGGAPGENTSELSLGNSSFSLADASPSKLVATLKHPTMLWRKHAQRLLVERGKLDVLPELLGLASDPAVDQIDLNVGTIHALWTLHGLGALDGRNRQVLEVAHQALRHQSAGVRRNAIMVLPHTEESTEALLASGVLGDSDAQVRLAAMLALSDLPPTAAAGPAIVKTMACPDNAGDRWIPDAAISAAATQAESYLAAVAKAKPSKQLAKSARIVALHYARGAPVETIAKLIHQLGRAEPKIASAIVSGLIDGWPAHAHLAMNEALETDLLKLLDRTTDNQRGALVKLARGWGSAKFEQYAEEVSRTLMAELDDESLNIKKRTAAARRLIEFSPGDREPIEALLARITPQTPPELSSAIVRTLARSESSAVGSLVVEQLVGFTPKVRSAAITVLLSRPQSTVALLKAINGGTVQLAELSLDQKQALASHPDRKIRKQAGKVLKLRGAIPNANRQAVLEKYLPIAAQTGDAVAGLKVFTNHCAKCHQLNGVGQKIGPDLSGMAVHPKAELLAQILDPNRSVEGNFRVYTVLTTDGLVINGLLASESKTVLELFDAEGKKQTVLREDIEELVASSKSFMPEGFEKLIPPAQMRDLLELLRPLRKKH